MLYLIVSHPSRSPTPALHSKSSSLAPATRKRLVAAICQSVSTLSSILGGDSSSSSSTSNTDATNTDAAAAAAVVSQAFRDALSCHLYMLFSVMHFTESECKSSKSLQVGGSSGGAVGGGKSKKLTAKEQERRAEAEQLAASRELCARAMLSAARSMSANANRLWRRGVPAEDVVNLPCRIAYQILEAATGVQARKACCGTEALGMIAATVDAAPANSNGSIVGTIVAALVDLLHSYEHMAALVAELCTMVNEQPTNRLAIELMREKGQRSAIRGPLPPRTGQPPPSSGAVPDQLDPAPLGLRAVPAPLGHRGHDWKHPDRGWSGRRQ